MDWCVSIDDEEKWEASGLYRPKTTKQGSKKGTFPVTPVFEVLLPELAVSKVFSTQDLRDEFCSLMRKTVV